MNIKKRHWRFNIGLFLVISIQYRYKSNSLFIRSLSWYSSCPSISLYSSCFSRYPTRQVQTRIVICNLCTCTL